MARPGVRRPEGYAITRGAYAGRLRESATDMYICQYGANVYAIMDVIFSGPRRWTGAVIWAECGIGF